ncbi:hypothetical protein KZZ52_44945 [Dactylosporangium sp. AC04546]|nr:hypothetical protein [Dactylosporangium sp. AC04546]WVK81065.1 hypothetical protein KZZ52_44945 [Dactylosporangium sp. AC04546]
MPVNRGLPVLVIARLTGLLAVTRYPGAEVAFAAVVRCLCDVLS